MDDLSSEQESDLVRLIKEDFGSALDREAFTELSLQLLEDIAGFETATRSRIQALIIRMWRVYDGQR